MVPRSYLHQAAAPNTATKRGQRAASPIQGKECPHSDAARRSQNRANGKKPCPMLSAPATTASKPKAILKRDRTAQELKIRRSAAKGYGGANERVVHDPNAISSSMAALCAVTSLPRQISQSTALRASKSKVGSRIQPGKAELRRGEEKHPLSASSFQAWNILLSPPSELDVETSSIDSDSALDADQLVRSPSIESVPSLDTDYGSSPSASTPSTPATLSPSPRGTQRKQKGISLSKTENCLVNHPLQPHSLTDSFEKDSPVINDLALASPSRTTVKPKPSLKSNLTASLTALRSAARSFSDLVSREEYLARSMVMMAPPFIDERRPSPSRNTTDPALRQYSNQNNVSPTELHLHHECPHFDEVRNRCTASIQLQTYERVPQPSSKASAPPIFTSACSTSEVILGAAADPYSTTIPRQREVRENSDFLRVIVLETNMRRKGSMKDAAPGRARMWLPARQVSKQETQKWEDGVPRRWLPQTV